MPKLTHGAASEEAEHGVGAEAVGVVVVGGVVLVEPVASELVTD